MPTVVPDRLGRRRLKRLLRAFEYKVLEGAIPWDSDAAVAEHARIDREYNRAWEMMLAHLDESALTILDLSERLKAARKGEPR